MFICHDEKGGQSHNVQVAEKSFDNAAELKYFDIVTFQKCIHESINIRLNLGNAFHHSYGIRITAVLLCHVVFG
jgi:hypothetical protein